VWVRSAYWVGSPRRGEENEFRRLLDEEVVPAMRRLPGVADVKVLWPQRFEDDPPNLACQVVVEFASLADLERMLAAPERQLLRPRVLHLRSLFKGTLSHIDFEVGAQP
jgi:hypothetical protein